MLKFSRIFSRQKLKIEKKYLLNVKISVKVNSIASDGGIQRRASFSRFDFDVT